MREKIGTAGGKEEKRIMKTKIVLPIPGSHVVAAGIGGKEKDHEERRY